MFIQNLPFIGKINFKGINYSSPDSPKLPELKADTFERSQEAPLYSEAVLNAAVELVKESAGSDDPRESLTIISDNNIIGHEIGDIHFVEPSKEMNEIIDMPESKVVAVHSHTPSTESGHANPISLEDLIMLMNKPGIKQVFAVNPKGQYSMLKKVAPTKPVTMEIFGDCLKKLDEEVVDALDDTMKERYLKLEEELHAPGSMTGSVWSEKRELEQTDAYKEGIIRGTHSFWTKYAPALGLMYDTNYEYLN